jgi:alpha-L-rhamnosidase
MLKIENLRCEYLKNPINIDTDKPRFSWTLSSDARNQFQSAYQIIVSSTLENALKEIGDLWDSGKVDSAENLNVEYSGNVLKSFERYYWRVRCWNQNDEASPFSEVAIFETAVLKDEDWKAKWLTKKNFESFTSGGDPVSGRRSYKQFYAAYFRKDFELKAKVKRARAYICGLGVYELRINGEKVGDNVLDPGQTDYSKLALYSTYDVTDLLKDKNAIGVILGNGRHIESYGYGKPRLIIQIMLEYEDESKEFILSDESWKVFHGPIQENGIYYGEKYDARLEMPGWDEFGFDDKDWESVELIENGPKLKSQLMPPIKITDTIKPVKMWSPKSGVYVYDFGQNFTGWVKLKVRGPRGTTVKIRHSELLKEDGTLNTSTIRLAEATDTYILKGNGMEVYEPRFTYHGFRYIEITGFPGVPTLENVEGKFLHTAVESTGKFNCSNELINKIHRNTIWGQLSNLMSIPTDCPQRDERMGWMGDAQLSAEEAIFNFDMAQFYTKYLLDIKLSQKEDGSVSDVVPPYWPLYPPDPAWGTAYITIAWYMYLYYRDKRVLEEHYEHMKKYVEFLKNNSDNHIIRKLGKYGDWCPPGSIMPKRTPVELTSTFYYYSDTLTLSEIAEILGKKEDSDKYKKLAEEIKEAFNKEFLKKGKDFVGNEKTFYLGVQMGPRDTTPTGQTSNVLPLYLDVVPSEHKEAIFKTLIELVEVHQDSHLDTGIVGTRYLFDVLANNGRFDLAYKVATQRTYPGWGYMIEEGATTLWERWEKLEGAGMNSHNHIMLGSIDAWFYRYIGGLTLLEPGWKKFRVKPYFVDELKFAKAELETFTGNINVSWERCEKRFKLIVSVPVNTQALVYVPILREGKITESGRELFANEKITTLTKEIRFVETEENYAVFEVGSGWYEFESF